MQLTSAADPTLYDYPLTLRSKVPSAWKQCSIRQGSTKAIAAVENGVVTYDALPGGGEIVIRSIP